MTITNIKNLIKLTIFCNLIILDKKLKVYPIYIHPFYFPYNRPILSLNESLRETLIKGRSYLNKCLDSSNTISYIKSVGLPKVSIIIPLYNCEKSIESAIHSVQYQNMTQIEINLVNDFSTDNTLKLVENLQKLDHRIRIINNHKNLGTLYSRSIGALMSRGEYIFNLDNDDLFFDNVLIDFIFSKAKTQNLDLVHYKTIIIHNYTTEIERMSDIFTILYPNEFYLEQPELSVWMIKYKNRYVVHNNMIWDKCIRTSIYTKAINLMGFNRYSKYVSWAEDTSINFIIMNLANNFKYFDSYGIVHYKGRNTASNTQSINTKIYGEIFFLDILFDFCKNNTRVKNHIIDQVFYIYKRYKFNSFNNDTNCIYLKSVLYKIINCTYITKLNIRKIKKLFISFFI